MNIPTSCGHCKYGNTFDLSIDDLCTYCMVLDSSQDWCDFPRRRDNTLRMGGCPLPHLTEGQIKSAEQRLKTHKLKKEILHRALNGNTKLIRKRNWGRLRKLAEADMKKSR